MSEILTEDIIPDLKAKIVSNASSNLRVYDVEPTTEGVLNIIDSSLPSTAVSGLQFMIRPSATVTNPKISLNGGAAVSGVVQPVVGGRATDVRNSNFKLDSYSLYLVVYGANFWRFVNVFDPIRTNDIADGAVDGTKANVASIMNTAGQYGHLFGLGGEAISISHQDLNTIPVKTGFYSGWNVTNSPDYDSHWHVLQITLSGFTVQIAYNAYSSGLIYQRVYHGRWGSWQPWVQLSTPKTTLDQVYPVGSIYISHTLDTPEKVATALGGGTWVRSNEGLTIVGYASADTDFNSIKTAGNKTQALRALIGAANSDTSKIGYYASPAVATFDLNKATYTVNGASAIGGGVMNHSTPVVQSTGHQPTTLQPYSVRYIYRRTA